MSAITIATFNWKNNYHLYQTDQDRSDCQAFINFLLENNIDILGGQEFIKRNLIFCEPVLHKYNYKIYGNGRYLNGGNLFPLSLANEYNPIIAKIPLSKDVETISLPWRGAAFPRIITKCEFENFVFLNTHLEHLNNLVKQKQLDAIYAILAHEVKYGKQIILTGDFNMTMENKNMQAFVTRLKELGLMRVQANESTHALYKSGPIDHIFLSASQLVDKIETVNMPISDHKAILVKVRSNN